LNGGPLRLNGGPSYLNGGPSYLNGGPSYLNGGPSYLNGGPFADTAESRTVAVGMLLDRLAGRLGRSAVFEPRPVADPQPEHAWLPVAPGAGKPVSSPALSGRRPVCMCARPIPLEQPLSIGPEGPPGSFHMRGRQHVVAAVHGPERIETAWWRGPTVRRDYYVVETESGERFWVFRRLRDGNWFLHGVFA